MTERAVAVGQIWKHASDDRTERYVVASVARESVTFVAMNDDRGFPADPRTAEVLTRRPDDLDDLAPCQFSGGTVLTASDAVISDAGRSLALQGQRARP